MVIKQESSIVFYDHNESVENYEFLWSQKNISSPWPDTTEMQQLIVRLDQSLAKRSPIDQFHVLQGVLTPTTATVISSFLGLKKDKSKTASVSKNLPLPLLSSAKRGDAAQSLSPPIPTETANYHKSLASMAAVVTPVIVENLQSRWADASINIAIVDHFHSTDFVQVMVAINVDRAQKRLKARQTIDNHPEMTDRVLDLLL